ncbi:MAG TPA: DUF4124 domain-containing protein [Gemmatimonadaceae bacterium]|nr:DUF4124 domain-containing protein [Gemmatimonadaceae bacterium]
MQQQTLAAALGAAMVAFAFAAPVAAATYKWVDERGVVHYTDHLPPEQVDKARIELNKDGVPVKKVDPAPTPEQRKAKEAEEAKAREAVRAKEEGARRNRALLQSYTSEAEIELARRRALSTLEGVIQSAQMYSEQLVSRKAEAERKKAEYGNKPIPPALERESTTVDAELAQQADLLALKKREVAEVQSRYDAILARWRELTSDRNALEAAMAPAPANAQSQAPSPTRK